MVQLNSSYKVVTHLERIVKKVISMLAFISYGIEYRSWVTAAQDIG